MVPKVDQENRAVHRLLHMERPGHRSTRQQNASEQLGKLYERNCYNMRLLYSIFRYGYRTRG